MTNTHAIHELLRTSQLRRDAAGSLDRHILHERAKIVVCVVDGTPVPALVPASLGVNLERLLDLAGAKAIRLAHDDEWLGPRDAERIFADVRLAAGHTMVFTTNTSSETMAIRWSDFARSARPVVGDFAEPLRDRVGAYRLSYRE
jgi:hypothetical protein